MEDEIMKCSTPSLLFSKLPEDLKLEILSRLPSESLTAIKSVSKQWNDLLPIKPFLFGHFCAHANPKLYLFSCGEYPKGGDRMYLLSFEPPCANMKKVCDDAKETLVMRARRVPLPLRRSYSLSNICHGLVCLYFIDNDEFYVRLFSVRTQIAIPLRGMTAISSDGCSGNLCQRTFKCLLGFDATSNEFKVLRIVMVDHDTRCPSLWGFDARSTMRNCEYEILNLGSSSNSWEPIKHELVPLTIRKGCPHSYTEVSCVDGVIYWLHASYYWRSRDTFPTLAAYDLKHGRFRAVEIDKLVGLSSMKGMTCYLTTLKGSPTLFLHKHGDNKMRKFTMENHTSSNATWNISEIYSPFSSPYHWNFQGGIVLTNIGWFGSSTIRFKCYDLENGTTWDIESETLLDISCRSRFSTVVFDEL